MKERKRKEKKERISRKLQATESSSPQAKSVIPHYPLPLDASFISHIQHCKQKPLFTTIKKMSTSKTKQNTKKIYNDNNK